MEEASLFHGGMRTKRHVLGSNRPLPPTRHATPPAPAHSAFRTLATHPAAYAAGWESTAGLNDFLCGPGFVAVSQSFGS
jgi:hypothetical protein